MNLDDLRDLLSDVPDTDEFDLDSIIAEVEGGASAAPRETPRYEAPEPQPRYEAPEPRAAAGRKAAHRAQDPPGAAGGARAVPRSGCVRG